MVTMPRVVSVVLGVVLAIAWLPSAPADAHSLKPRLTISASARAVTVGGMVTLSGKLTHAGSYRRIELQGRYLGSQRWHTLKRVKVSTSSHKWRYRVKITDERERYFRVLMPKHRGIRKSVSRAVRVNVNSKPWYTTIGFATKTIQTASLMQGTSRVITAGSAGVMRHYRTIGSTVVHQTVKAPVTRVVEQGTGAPVPTVVSMKPDHGPVGGGTRVTVSGWLLGSATRVVVGGSDATALDVRPSQISFTAPGQGAAGDYSVVVYAGSQVLTTCSPFKYRAVVDLSELSPSSGPETGGTAIAINGANLDSVTKVTFGTSPASIRSATPSSLIVVAPAHSPGQVSVNLYQDDDVAISSVYTYTSTAVSTAKILPASGSVSGGTKVTITGSGFAKVTKVLFTPRGRTRFELTGMPSIAGSGLSVASDSTLTVSTPQNLAGDADVSVVTASGATVVARYEYNLSSRGASTYESQVLAALNRARSTSQVCGTVRFPAVGKLSWNPAVADFSHAYSKDVVLRMSVYMSNFHSSVSHNWPGLPAREYRQWLVGDDWLVDTYPGDEIIQDAFGSTTADQMVQGWLDSPAHCETLMRAGYTSAGVGVYASGSGLSDDRYGTVNFR